MANIDFELSKLMVESITQIHQILDAFTKQNSIISNFGYSDTILKSLCRKLLKLVKNNIGARSGSFFLLSNRGTIYKVATYGDNLNSNTSCFSSAFTAGNNEIVLKLPIKRTKAYLSESLIGYITLYREKPFHKDEVQILKTITNVLSHTLFHFMDIRTEIYIEKINNKTKYILNKHQKPGSIIYRIQNSVQEALQARASYFCTTIHSKCYFEYVFGRRRGSKKIIRNGSWHKLPSQIHNYMLKSPFFVYSYLDDYKSLKQILRQYVNFNEDSANYTFWVFKNDNVPIAFLILEFDKRRYFNADKIQSLNFHQDVVVKKSVKYLFQRRSNKMIVDPLFKSRDTKVELSKVFVLMPFTLDWSDRIWEKMIRPTVENKNLTAIRANDLYGADIMEDIWRGILKSRFVIADITDRNPNVFYELGIAHAIGKPFILLTQTVNDIPFDLNRYRHIIYEDNYDGYEKLKTELSNMIQDILQDSND